MTALRWAAALALGVACAHARPAAKVPCPGELAAPSSIEGRFLLRLRMQVTSPDSEQALELAVQKRGDELVLVAFDPLGAPIFSVTQTDGEVRVARRMPRRLIPLHPENALRDVHRARFLGDPVDELARPGCGYRVRFVELGREALP